jgi:glucose dehydrogenase
MPRHMTCVSSDQAMAMHCSLRIAINPDTGRMAWYFQTTPGDHWDFDSVQKLILADLSIDGQTSCKRTKTASFM